MGLKFNFITWNYTVYAAAVLRLGIGFGEA